MLPSSPSMRPGRLFCSLSAFSSACFSSRSWEWTVTISLSNRLISSAFAPGQSGFGVFGGGGVSGPGPSPPDEGGGPSSPPRGGRLWPPPGVDGVVACGGGGGTQGGSLRYLSSDAVSDCFI